jgi:hypothetical protein
MAQAAEGTHEEARQSAGRAALRPRPSNQALLRSRPGVVPRPSQQGGLLQRKCSCGGSGETCAACKEGGAKLQRAAAGSARLAVAPPIVHEVLRSPGQPLEPDVRGCMEEGFGHDFGGVRVHTDGQAAESARAVNASAYTVGQHVVFGAGRYAPETIDGQRLLAHELTHTIQQQAIGSPAAPGSLRINSPEDLLERNADDVAAAALLGRARVGGSPGNLLAAVPSGVSVARGPLLQRACDQPESFYQASSDYCLDLKYSPTTHKGKRCYRQVISASASGCPSGNHCCFDDAGNVEDSYDTTSIATSKQGDGSCAFDSSWCIFLHVLTDYIPGLFAEGIAGCLKACEGTDGFMKIMCQRQCQIPAGPGG